MIISPGRRFIFVHIPKTGGTSLALALEGRAMKDDILIGDTPKARRRRPRLKKLQPKDRLRKHAGLRDIDGVVSTEQLAAFFVVTLVRNPWDRLVSYYCWLRDQSFDHPAVELSKLMEFHDFLRTDLIRNSFSAAPYRSYVTDVSGKVRCDLFARLEHLQTDLQPFETHLGFPLGQLPVENPSRRSPDYRQYFDPEGRDIVAQICADDIDQFGYSF